MKTKQFILSLVLILVGTQVIAQTEDEASYSPSLNGVWQLHQPTGNFLIPNLEDGTTEMDESQLQPTYYYKFYSDNNEFKALFLTPVLSLITISGTYEVISTNQFIEHVGYHSNTFMANSDVTLGYSFIKDDYVVLSYKNELGRIAYEVWKRVKQGDPNIEMKKIMETNKNKQNGHE